MKEQEKLWRMRARHKLLQGDQHEKDNMITTTMTNNSSHVITIQGREIHFRGFGFESGIIIINPNLVSTGSS
ncbi:hypothetical protein L484_005966 [Morus notabilis]|uniref:Uncharacterized protein n=1 Tax=Morus notabilis TaxID=981085 RepID=W9RV29_9ROSA|nr:hypothetical protein L484_005966 [Morus notabilis]